MAEQTKREQLQQYLAARALQDPDFREKLLEAPKTVIEREMGMRFPTTLDVLVHEERLNTLHVVLHLNLESSCTFPSTIAATIPPGAENVEDGKITFWQWMRGARA